MEDDVPLPYFHEAQGQQQEQQAGRASGPAPTTTQDDDSGHFQYHFLAMIALRRLIARVHNVIHECERAMQAEPLWRGVTASSPESNGVRRVQAHQKLAASTAQAASESFDDYGGFR
ncbi:hypothetical protein LTR53_000035, partial [Teratosphaeriaceae sp. CCFEE 6253]